MKRFLNIICTLIALGCSSAAAEEFSVGLRFQGFSINDPSQPIFNDPRVVNFALVLMPAWDFDTASNGPGIRGSLKLGLILIGGSFDAYYRFPIDSYKTNIYAGAGVGFLTGGLIDTFSYSEAHGLIGIDVVLPGSYNNGTFFFELNLGAAIAGEAVHQEPDSRGLFSYGPTVVYPLAGGFSKTLTMGMRFVFR